MSDRLARSCLALALTTGAVAGAAAPVSAETSISVTPAIIDLAGVADGRGRITITITNRGDEPFGLVTSLGPYEALEGDRSAVEWLRVRPRRLRIAPGASRDATLVLRIPKDIASGGRYALVGLSTVPSGEDDVTTISGRIAVPVLLAAKGTGPLESELTLERFAPFVEADGRIGFRALVRNDGNVHARVSGAVSVGREDEDILADLLIPERTVLPGASRELSSHGTLPLASEPALAATLELAPSVAGQVEAVTAISREVDFATEPSLGLGDLAICERLDGGPELAGVLVNEGSIGLSTLVRFEVLDEGGVGISSVTPATPTSDVWPGETLALGAVFDRRLLSGDYTLRVAASNTIGVSVESSMPFSIGGDPAMAAPLCPSAALETPAVSG